MKRPGEDRVRSACHDKRVRNSMSSEPNRNLLYIGLHGLDSLPSATSPDSGVVCGRLMGMPEEAPSLSSGHGDTELMKILEEVRYMARRFRNQDEKESMCSEWKFAASVIDRLCLIAFSLFTVFCTIGILMSAPNFVEAISKDFFS